MSQKSRPILHSNLLYKMGQDFLDLQYDKIKEFYISKQWTKGLITTCKIIPFNSYQTIWWVQGRRKYLETYSRTGWDLDTASSKAISYVSPMWSFNLKKNFDTRYVYLSSFKFQLCIAIHIHIYIIKKKVYCIAYNFYFFA